METIQVVLDAKLLQATDRAARRAKLNRSALIRNAVRVHLKQLQIQDLEERDRRGYALRLAKSLSAPDWESEAVWPEK